MLSNDSAKFDGLDSDMITDFIKNYESQRFYFFKTLQQVRKYYKAEEKTMNAYRTVDISALPIPGKGICNPSLPKVYEYVNEPTYQLHRHIFFLQKYTMTK